MSSHCIEVKGSLHVEDKPYALFDRGNLCGNRLFKGEDQKKGVLWPFSDPDWMFHRTKGEAQTAAKMLQDYLDKREAKLA